MASQPVTVETRDARPSLSDTLAAAVLTHITENGYRSGDALPSVQQLALRSNVSNATMREALRRLEATGSVELRHGSGVFVGTQLERVVLANPNSIAPSSELVLQLIGARLVIEPPLAALAAVHRTEAHLVRLDLAIAVARSGPSRPAGLNFHRELAAAAGNVVLYEVVDALLTVHRGEQRQIRRLSRERAQDLLEHREILGAVRAGDPLAAALASRSHLEAIQSAIAGRGAAER